MWKYFTYKGIFYTLVLFFAGSVSDPASNMLQNYMPVEKDLNKVVLDSRLDYSRPYFCNRNPECVFDYT